MADPRTERHIVTEYKDSRVNACYQVYFDAIFEHGTYGGHPFLDSNKQVIFERRWCWTCDSVQQRAVSVERFKKESELVFANWRCFKCNGNIQ